MLLCLLLTSLHIQLCFWCCAGHPKALGWLEAFAPVLVISLLPGNVVSGLEMGTHHFAAVLLQYCITCTDEILSLSTIFPVIFFFDRGTTHLLQGLSCQVLLAPACHHSKPHLPTTACTHKEEHGHCTHRVSDSSFPLSLLPRWARLTQG